MYKQYYFVPNHRVLAFAKPENLGLVDIINEPMVHSCGLALAREFGGIITNFYLGLPVVLNFINNCPKNKYLVIDTRTVMLMPGQYPAIPGWHCDAVRRPSTTAQPNLWEQDYNCRHLAVHLSTRADERPESISSTHFLRDSVNLDVNEESVWSSVDTAVNHLHCPYTRSEDGEIWEFTRDTLHRASPAVARGWRWWMRISYYHNPPRPARRTQVQVYTVPGLGW